MEQCKSNIRKKLKLLSLFVCLFVVLVQSKGDRACLRLNLWALNFLWQRLRLRNLLILQEGHSPNSHFKSDQKGLWKMNDIPECRDIFHAGNRQGLFLKEVQFKQGIFLLPTGSPFKCLPSMISELPQIRFSFVFPLFPFPNGSLYCKYLTPVAPRSTGCMGKERIS